jgi:class 3 adenylate cyclase
MPGMDAAKTHYAKTVDGVHIAYQVWGQGAVDLMFVTGFMSNVETEYEAPFAARFLERLASFSRVIIFDQRGNGLSDNIVGTPTLETRSDDIRAVLDAVGSTRPVLFGHSEGGSLAAFFAATHPDRVLALALYAASARRAWAADYPLGQRMDEHQEWRTEIDEGWGSIELARGWIQAEAPSHADDPDWVTWLAKACRHAASPAAAIAFLQVQYASDVRSVLPLVQAPTLILSRAEDDHDRSADLAERIPGARHVRVPGKDRIPYAGNVDALLDEVERFIQSVSASQAVFDRVLATVLFTDIVGSTQKADELGDRDWRALLERHNQVVRAMVGRYRGTEVDTAGDGFLATFDGPARAVRCAQEIISAVLPLGLQIRAGLHTGEIERSKDDVYGIAVHIGARVGALAAPSEVVVSQTVKDLVAGSGLKFEDAGEHELKGIPDRWHLYRATPSTPES